MEDGSDEEHDTAVIVSMEEAIDPSTLSQRHQHQHQHQHHQNNNIDSQHHLLPARRYKPKPKNKQTKSRGKAKAKASTRGHHNVTEQDDHYEDNDDEEQDEEEEHEFDDQNYDNPHRQRSRTDSSFYLQHRSRTSTKQRIAMFNFARHDAHAYDNFKCFRYPKPRQVWLPGSDLNSANTLGDHHRPATTRDLILDLTLVVILSRIGDEFKKGVIGF